MNPIRQAGSRTIDLSEKVCGHACPNSNPTIFLGLYSLGERPAKTRTVQLSKFYQHSHTFSIQFTNFLHLFTVTLLAIKFDNFGSGNKTHCTSFVCASKVNISRFEIKKSLSCLRCFASCLLES